MDQTTVEYPTPYDEAPKFPILRLGVTNSNPLMKYGLKRPNMIMLTYPAVHAKP